MEVIKRNGSREPVRFDKITARIEKLSYSLDARCRFLGINYAMT